MAHRVTEAAPPPPRQRKSAKTAEPKAAPARRRGGEARAIADLIPAIGGTAFRKFGFVHSSIVTRWPEIVGAKLARATSPVALRFPQGKRADGTLTLAVAGAQAPLVQHVLPDIIARVNAYFGYAAVARIRIEQGRPVKPATKAPLPVVDPGVPAATIPLSPGLAAIADPELRSVLEGLATSLAKRDALPKVR